MWLFLLSNQWLRELTSALSPHRFRPRSCDGRPCAAGHRCGAVLDGLGSQRRCVEVEDYYAAISYLAQTSLREAVGRSTVAEVALRRDQLDEEIKVDIEKEASAGALISSP